MVLESTREVRGSDIVESWGWDWDGGMRSRGAQRNAHASS